MAIDDKTLKNIKKKVDLEQLKKLFKDKVPKDFLEKRFKKKDDESLSPKEEEQLKKFLDKFKEKKKITPKVKPDPDKKNTPIIPKDFFKDKRFFPEKFNPKNKRKFYENMPFKPDPDNKRPDMIPMPLPFDPNKKIPKMEPMPYKIKPSDKMPGVQLLKKGGTVKGYKAGGEVKTDKSPNSGMITKRGWGKSRKT